MSVTLSSDYQTLVGKPHKEDWLVRLYDNNDNFVGIAFDDSTDDAGNFYYGCIQNKPTIRESINLAKGTSSTSNVSLTISNFSYQGNPISEELLFGSYYYINHDVKIYSRLSQNVSRPYYWNENSTLWESDTGLWESETLSSNLITVTEQLLYTGRLVSITHDHKQLTLQIVSKMPWDDIEIPNTRTTNRNVLIPVSYGNFTKNTNSTYASPQFLTDLTATTYRPVPLNEAEGGGGTYGYVIGEDNITSNCEPAFWDKDLESFLPLSSGTSASVSKNGAYNTKGSVSLRRGFKFRPADDDDVSNGGILNPENAYDTSTASYANRSTGSTITYEHKYHYGGFTGDMNQASTDIVWEIVITDETLGVVGSIILSYKFGDDSYVEITRQSAVNTYTGTATIADKPGNIDEPLTIKMAFTAGSPDWTANCKIKDILTTYEVNKGEDQHKLAYTGGDGLTRSYSSGNTTEIQEAHRDLLHRYTTLDLSSTPTGWSDLDTDRSGWNIRYWLLEPEDLKSVLDKLAFEGGFNWYLKADGQTIKYIHLPDTPSSDHTLTEDDINNLKISHVPFNSLITKSEYSYEKHPAENRYISTATYTDSTLRTNYNIGTEDNIKQIKLDALVANVTGGTGANASHGNYYDTIYSTVNILASCDVINDSIGYAIELGDFIQWSSMPTEPFGANFSSNYYIVTSIKRSPGKTSIETMEVPDTSGGGGGG